MPDRAMPSASGELWPKDPGLDAKKSPVLRSDLCCESRIAGGP